MNNFGPYYPYTPAQVPATYPQAVNTQPTYNNTAISPMANLVIGVQGIDAAKAYPLGPNTRGYFLDTEQDFIYIKEIDPDGVQRKPIRILKCEEISEDQLKAPIKEQSVQLPPNVVTTDILDSYLEKYLTDHQYKPYIPRAKK